MQVPQPVSIENDYVRLNPLSSEAASEYLEIGREPEIWTYLAGQPFSSQDDAERWIASMLKRNATSGDVTFSVYDKVSDKLAGSSSYLDVRVGHGGLEIGYTWYAKAFQRTHVNTATKLALFEHAFDALGVNRVQLQTDARNQASRKAIARIGAVEEGILRKHKIYPNGYVRDSAIFSVTVEEWPRVRERLVGMLRR